MTTGPRPWLPAARLLLVGEGVFWGTLGAWAATGGWARLNFVLSFTDQVGLLDVASAALSLATAGTLALAWRAS